MVSTPPYGSCTKCHMHFHQQETGAVSGTQSLCFYLLLYSPNVCLGWARTRNSIPVTHRWQGSNHLESSPLIPTLCTSKIPSTSLESKPDALMIRERQANLSCNPSFPVGSCRHAQVCRMLPRAWTNHCRAPSLRSSQDFLLPSLTPRTKRDVRGLAALFLIQLSVHVLWKSREGPLHSLQRPGRRSRLLALTQTGLNRCGHLRNEAVCGRSLSLPISP